MREGKENVGEKHGEEKKEISRREKSRASYEERINVCVLCIGTCATWQLPSLPIIISIINTLIIIMRCITPTSF